jgi:TRAP-type C4-dicarboxylate transport system substrate-binding protein
VLGGPKEHLSLCGTGSVALATIIPLYHPAEMPLHSFPNIPVWRTGEDAADGVHALEFDVPETAAIFEKEARKNNVKFLMWYAMGGYGIMSRLQATSLADLKGIKVGIFGGEYGARLEKQLGMVPVTTLTTEYYEVISKGVVDGIFSGPAVLIALKTYEPAKAFINTGLSAAGAPLIINLKIWESLPTDIQEVMMNAAREAVEYGKKVDADFINKGYKLYEKNGLVVTKALPAEEQKMLEGLWQEILEKYWVDNMAKKGFRDEANTIIKHWKRLKQEYRSR